MFRHCVFLPVCIAYEKCESRQWPLKNPLQDKNGGSIQIFDQEDCLFLLRLNEKN